MLTDRIRPMISVLIQSPGDAAHPRDLRMKAIRGHSRREMTLMVDSPLVDRGNSNSADKDADDDDNERKEIIEEGVHGRFPVDRAVENLIYVSLDCCVPFCFSHGRSSLIAYNSHIAPPFRQCKKIG